MLTKRRKLAHTKSASADANSNQSIISMFARQCSHSQLQNVQPDNQHVETGNLSEVTDRPRLDNKLSLSLRRKRLRTADAAINVSNKANNNNAVDISESSGTGFQSTDKMIDAVSSQQDDLLSNALLLPAESYAETILPVSSNEELDCNCANNKEEALISDENSVSDLLPAKQSAADSETAHVPYYLENFCLVLDTVFKDTFYAEWFNDDDLSTMHTFKNLNGNCCDLYETINIRLHIFIISLKDLLYTLLAF